MKEESPPVVKARVRKAAPANKRQENVLFPRSVTNRTAKRGLAILYRRGSVRFGPRKASHELKLFVKFRDRKVCEFTLDEIEEAKNISVRPGG